MINTAGLVCIAWSGRLADMGLRPDRLRRKSPTLDNGRTNGGISFKNAKNSNHEHPRPGANETKARARGGETESGA